MIQRATVPGKLLRPNQVRYIPRPTGCVLSTQEILDPSVHYPVLYHHLESSPYPKAGLICHAWFKELLYQENCCVPITYGTFQDPQGLSVLSTQEILDPSVHYTVLYQHLESSPYLKADLILHAWFKELLYQENGCVPIMYGTFQDPQGLSYPYKKYWTHRSIIQYYTITLNGVLTHRRVSYAMHDSKSYCTRKIAASQSRTVHSKTHRVCPIHTRNIGPLGPLSSTIPSPWIESLPKGRSHMPCMIQRATVPGKWLRPNHVRYIPRPTGSFLSTQEILDPSVHYPVLYHHLESSPYPRAGLICHAWFKELLYQENGCVPITYDTFQEPQGLSYPHKKYWTHRSIIQYYTITLNWVLTQMWVSYAMHDSKSYCTRKMAASQSRMVHSKTHRVCLSYPHKKYWTHWSIIQYYTITLNRVLPQRQVSYAMHDSKSYCTRKMAASQSRSVHSKTHRVNSYIQQLVQIKWDVAVHGRDLYRLKPTLGPPRKFQQLTRAKEVVITRLRIGHTKATKSHILCRGTLTICHHCGQTLTIDHMLMECAVYWLIEYVSLRQLLRLVLWNSCEKRDFSTWYKRSDILYNPSHEQYLNWCDC